MHVIIYDTATYAIVRTLASSMSLDIDLEPDTMSVEITAAQYEAMNAGTTYYYNPATGEISETAP